ncbi:hypothetical protein [Krasilnikovia sp. MM14-A1004]|uniref:hypothetical protein n=1 Tax=Krasilnikovia sp. MM14-A1004 TaxID=3373541 RepID=UPI00399C735C
MIGDALNLLDRLYAWLPGTLDRLPARALTLLVVPLVVAVVFVVPRVVVRRVLPWLGRYVLVPVTALAAGALAAAALVVDFLLARLFRLCRLPLTGLHYAIGDWAVGGSRGVRGVTRARVGQAARWLSRFSPGVLLLFSLVVTILWSAGYCGRNPAAGCTGPITQWWDDLWDSWQSVLG